MLQKNSLKKKNNLPCPQCTSSDAFTIYEEEDRLHGYCFSCGHWEGHEKAQEILLENSSSYKINKKVLDKQGNLWYPNLGSPRVDIGYPQRNNKEPNKVSNYRSISPSTLSKYKTEVYDDQVIYHGSEAGSYKVRTLEPKGFMTHGNYSQSTMFGTHLFPAGSAKCITITEGYEDAMSVYEMMGKYPAISVKSASSAVNDCRKQFEYINSFEKIYLCFDQDTPGQEALTKVARLFNNNKVYHVQLDKHKDANEYLKRGHSKEFISSWWNAKRFRPKGIISSFTEILATLKKDTRQIIGTYPFSSLQSMTYGMREGESVLIKALEKVGKTEFIRAIEYHVLKTTDHNIGIVHLEEEEPRSIKGLVGYELKKPAHLPDSGLNDQEIVENYKSVVKRDDRAYYYTHFGSDDPDIILETIRYLVSVCGCKFIFLDHISMVVSGHKDEKDERRKLDRISTEIAQMCRELKFCFVFISHVNDNGQTRGSRYISKAADLILSLNRNITSEDPIERNITKIMIEGNRFASMSGPAGSVYFNPDTFCLEEKTKAELEAKDQIDAPF